MRNNGAKSPRKIFTALQSPFASIRGRLFLLLLSVLVPIMLVQIVYVYTRFRDRVESQSVAYLEVSRAVATTFNNFVTDVLHQELAIGAGLTLRRPLSAEEMSRILRLNRHEFPAVRNFTWLDSHGHVLSSGSPSAPGLDHADRHYVQELLSGKPWVVSSLFRSHSTGKPVFTVSRAIRGKKGDLLGIVVATIEPDKLDQVISIHLRQDETLTIIDSHGEAVYREPEKKWTRGERKLLESRPFVRSALAGREVSGVFPCCTIGEKRVVAVVPIPSIGWAASVDRSKQAVMAPIFSQLLRGAVLIVLIMGAVFFVALVLSEGISSSARRLLEHTLALGRGDRTEPIEESGPVELKGLASAFNIMAEKVGAREKALKDAQERLFSVFEAVPACLYLQGPDHSIRFANRTFRETFGDPGEKHCYEVLKQESLPCKECSELCGFDTQTPRQWEWTDPGGRSFSTHSHPYTDSDGSALVLKLAVDISERKKTEDALRESREQLRDLSARLLSAQEEERRRIAAELHDSLGSSLTAIKVGIENARLRFDQKESAPELLDAPIAMTQLAISEVRKMMSELRPLVLDDFGILAALNWFFRQYRTTYSSVHIEEEIGIEEQDIPEELKIVIFRIVQEAFNNIAKYSGAEFVEFSLLKRNGFMELIIEDNGDGFDLEAVLSKIRERQGLGLTSMKERAELSGGAFTIRSVPGTGTRLGARWPLPADATSPIDHVTAKPVA
ncbi:MAG: cache domain-containing protein [Syntrophobacteraceae bacterium]